MIQASELHGYMFPGSPCCTQTETDGKAPCFTNYFVFQHAFYDKLHRYVQNKCNKKNNNSNSDNEMAIIILKKQSIIHEKWQVSILVDVQVGMYKIKCNVLWTKC